jgi:hypothetical protein
MPNVWPGSVAATVFRSLTSREQPRDQEPTAATGAAARNTLCSELAYASVNAWSTAGGSRFSALGLRAALLTPARSLRDPG